MHHGTASPEITEQMLAQIDREIKRAERAAALSAEKEALFEKSRAALGATGAHPAGKLVANDEGELHFQLGVIQRKVVINFGKEVAWVGMDAAQARALARSLLKVADHAS